jgi:transcriptional regulator with XRE-family HTH domain
MDLLRTLARAMGYSNAALARRANVSLASLVRYFKGDAEPRLDFVLAVVRAIGLEVREFLRAGLPRARRTHRRPPEDREDPRPDPSRQSPGASAAQGAGAPARGRPPPARGRREDARRPPARCARDHRGAGATAGWRGGG